jgi:hypothetical protein
MIKARARNVVLLGLSRMNTERMHADMPIRFDGAEIGLPGLTFVICAHDTEQSLIAKLQEEGFIGANTKIDDRLTGKEPA